MRTTAAFAAHEWRTQARSLRFRVFATLYVLAGSAPAALAYGRRLDSRMVIGGATYAGETAAVVPALTAVFVFLLSIDALHREREERSWSTVSLAGMSSSGYLLRRWLALQAVILPLTVVPFLAAAIAAGMGSGPDAVSPGPLVIPWLLHAVPLALAASALAVGVGTIAGGTAQAFLLAGLTLALVPPLINGVLAYLGFRFTSPLAWLDIQGLSYSIQRMSALLPGKDSVWTYSFPLEVSESPYDAGVAAEQYLGKALVPLALAAAVLGLAVLFLRRTRPDVRPPRISPTHPLRTFLAALARLRERYTPDPVPARADLLAIALALLVTAGVSALALGRTRHFDSLARERFAAEQAGTPAPTPDDVLPGRWRVEGTIGEGREVALAVAAEMRNTGREPRAHLAFELNPYLRIEKAEAGEGRLTLTRRWNRLAVDLEPPIPPGGTRELRFHLAGEPGEAAFNLPNRSDRLKSFYKSFQAHQRALFGRDLADLSRSYRVPSVSARRIELAATSLTPVPRYLPWELDPEKLVPEETFLPPAGISLSLAVPRDLFLADACGGIARGGRLASRCRLALADLMVAGGRYQTLESPPGGATVAVYPFHKGQGELHLGFLARGTGKLEEAWPGLGGLRRTVVLEWPESYVHELDTSWHVWSRRWNDPEDRQVRAQGELVLLGEMELIRTRPLDPDVLVARLVGGRLSRRRPVAPDDALLFRQLFLDLAVQRLGLGEESGAVVSGLRPGEEGFIQIPPPPRGYWSYWDRRFPALVAALRARMGEEPLRRAIDELLARKSAHPVTRAELYALLQERSEAPLARMIQDYFVEGLLPEPVLEGVTLRRGGGAGGGWTVMGRMVNKGTGEALCKIVLTTDLGPVETEARAGTGETGAFTLTTAHRPQSVWLDPDRQCHRLARKVSFADRFYFQGNEG